MDEPSTTRPTKSVVRTEQDDGDVIPTRITRRTIDIVCSRIPTPPSVDGVSGNFARENIVSGIRKQMVSFSGTFKQSPKRIDALCNFIVGREEASWVLDDDHWGLHGAEAMTVGLGTALQKLFSSVNTKNNKALATVASLDSVLHMVMNRNDQTITTHFLPAYFPEGNPTRQEVIGIRPRFVSVTIDDLLFRRADNNDTGYILGVMEPFEGDGVSPQLRELRRIQVEANYAPVIPARPWNRIGVRTAAGRYMTGSIQMIRLFFDTDRMYSLKITMSKLVNSINAAINNKNKTVYLLGSSGTDGIIDIYPGALANTIPEIEVAEQGFLGVTMMSNFPTTQISGVSGVTEMSAVAVELDAMIKTSRAHEYYVADAGRKLLLEAIETNYGIVLDWSDLETKSVLLSSIDQVQPTDIQLGLIEDKFLVVRPPSVSAGSGVSEAQLTSFYIQQVAGGRGLEDLWVCQLDVVLISYHSIDASLIHRMLEYCGLDIVHEAYHETLVDVIDKIYVRSVEDPKTIISRHNDIDSYITAFKPQHSLSQSIPIPAVGTNLSNFAYQRVLDKAKAYNIKPEILLLDPKSLELERIFIYHYAAMTCTKDETSKKDNPIIDYINSRPFWAVIRFPFIDKTKTVCNDWNTMTYACGTIITRNNYVSEINQLYSDQNIDRRHLEGYGDYTFELGIGAGIGYHATKGHLVGVYTSLGNEQAEKQISTSSHLKEPESTRSMGAAFMLSMPAPAPAIGGLSYQQRFVGLTRRQREEEQFRLSQRLGRAPKTIGGKQSLSTSAISFIVHSQLLETDPYGSITTFQLAGNVVIPEYPPTMSFRHTTTKHEASGILNQINSDLDRMTVQMRGAVPLEMKRPEIVSITGDFVDITALYDYIRSAAFDMVYKGAF